MEKGQIGCPDCGGHGKINTGLGSNAPTVDMICSACEGNGWVWDGGSPTAFPDAPEVVAEPGLRIEVDEDAVYCVIGRHKFKKDMTVIWTGVLGFVPLADMIPAQLIDWRTAVQLRATETGKFDLNVIRMVAPAGKRTIMLQ